MTKITPQVNTDKINQMDNPFLKKPDVNASNSGSTVTTVVSDEKKQDLNFQANIKRAQLENQLSTRQQTADENRDIRGVSTKTVLPKQISEGETQESVLQRTYEEMAFKAGISNEKTGDQKKSPREMFVEERMAANKEENKGEYRIFHSKTNSVFSDEDWAKQRETGSINMSPTGDDVTALKHYKAVSDYNDGIKTADDLIKGMENGDYRALDRVKLYSTNPNFQEGFLNQIGEDRFLKLEETLKDDLSYGKVLRDSLSLVSQSETTYSGEAETEPTFSGNVAKKASLEQLARLTENKFYPMGTNFLVEAGKKVTTPQVGWRTENKDPIFGETFSNEFADKNARTILEAVSRSPQASNELLQDENFTKNALKMSNMGQYSSVKDSVADIIRQGTSKAAKEANSEGVEKAIINLSKTLRDGDYLSTSNLERTANDALNTKNLKKINPQIANALTDVYVNNTEMFSDASGTNSKEMLNSGDVKEFIKAIQPYYSVKDEKGAAIGDKVAIATALEYNKLLLKAKETGDFRYTERAANLAGNYINSTNKGNIEEAKEADARRELFAKVAANTLEVATFNLTKAGATSEIIADLAGKFVATGTENKLKGSAVENAEELNEESIKKQQTTNSVTIVQVFEADEYAIANGKKESTAEQKQNAEKFLSDLRTYNDSLPADSKILDLNGRLINPSQMTEKQRGRVEKIFNSDESAAGRGLYERMEKMRDKLNGITDEKLH